MIKIRGGCIILRIYNIVGNNKSLFLQKLIIIDKNRKHRIAGFSIAACTNGRC
jgi:hypothetical protein